MDIGEEEIRLSESEQAVLSSGAQHIAESLSIDDIERLQKLVEVRLLDKYSLMDEMQRQHELGRQSVRAFQLRSDIVLLETAYNQILDYFIPPRQTPDNEE